MGDLLSNEVVVALIGALLGAPFLAFIISLFKARAEKNSIISTGANTTVQAMQTALISLRNELEEVREDLTNCQKASDAAAKQHARDIAVHREMHTADLARRDQEIIQLRGELKEMRELYEITLQARMAENDEEGK